MNKNRDVPKHCLKVIYSCRGGRVICSIARHCSAHWLAVGYRAKCVSVPPSMKYTWQVTGNLEDFLHIFKIHWDLLQKLLQMDKIMFYLSLTPLGGGGCRNTEKMERTDLSRCPDFNLILNLVHISLIFKVIDLWIWELVGEPVLPLGFRENKVLDHNTYRDTQMPLSVSHLNYVREFYAFFTKKN